MSQSYARNFLPFITLFWLVFDLKLIGSLGSAFLTLIICLFIFLLKPMKYYGDLKDLLNFFSYFIVLYIILLIYVFTRVIFDGASDISYLLTMLKTTLILLSTLLYIVVFYRSDIKNNFINIFFLNACICLFFGTFSDYKFYLLPFQYGGEAASEFLGSNPFRNAFLSGSGYFGISSLYGLAFAFCLKIVIDANQKNKFDYFKLLIIAIAGLFAGRIALICYLIAILYFVLIKANLRILLFSLISFSVFVLVINTVPAFEGVKTWFDEMFFNKSIQKSESFSQFKDTFSIPDSQFTLFLGDAKYGDSISYYGGSDSGFIRNIYFGGLVYLLLLLATFFSIIYRVKNIFYIYVFIFISLFLHFKGVFIFNNPGFFGVFLIFSIYLFREEKDKILARSV